MNQKTEAGTERIPVLVVGDWIIDEHWLIAAHRSETSSHTGKGHYRSLLYKQDDQIRGLGAAGSVARILHGLQVMSRDRKSRKGIKKTIQVYGLGMWRSDDTKLIASLFSGSEIRNETPLTLCGMEPLCGRSWKPGKKVRLCGDRRDCDRRASSCGHLKTLAKERSKNDVTARSIRMYYSSAGSEPKLTNRVDWLPLRSAPVLDKKSCKKLLRSFGVPFRHIVVSDHSHGCISRELIECLLKTYGDADWYIRTKDMDAKWVTPELSKKLLLRMVGADYIPSRSRIRRWFYGSEVGKNAVCELLDFGQLRSPRSGKLLSARERPERWVLGLHNNNSLIMLHNSRGQKDIELVALPSSKDEAAALVGDIPDQGVTVGRSSVVFASCIASLLGCYGGDSQLDAKKIIKRAAAHGSRWSESYRKNFECIASEASRPDRKSVKTCGDFTVAIAPGPEESLSERNDNQKPVTAGHVIEQWTCAHSKQGIVTYSDNSDNSKEGVKKFDLWRGHTAIGNYVAIRHGIRTAVGDLYLQVGAFLSRPSNRTSLNCLLVGDPGFGKTLLAKRLADTFNLRRLLFNLSQLTTLDQINDCFDEISSVQNEQPDKTVLVFFDEIDARVADQHTFSLFLSPMLDGTYRQGSHTHGLRPAVWIFAGTSDPDKRRGAKSKSNARGGRKRANLPMGGNTKLLPIRELPKGPDFLSRINGPIINLNYSKNDALATRKTEQVYWGVSLLCFEFRDVTKVSEGVLQYFHDFPLGAGVRQLEQKVKKFRNIQYGEVKLANLPKIVGKDKGDEPERPRDDDLMIDIVADPPRIENWPRTVANSE